MKRVKELLMRQMELLSMVAEEQVEHYEDPNIEGIAQAMAAVAAEIRRIEEPRSTVRLATSWTGKMQGGERDERQGEAYSD